MGADHHHDSGGLPDAANRRQWRRLAVALASSVVVLVAVAVGGLLSGSLALLADAAHQFADVFALALALTATTLAARPPSQQRTFGWERAEVLAAGADAVLLLGVTAWVAVEAVSRLRHPQPVDAPLMLAAAAFGLVAGAVSLGFLHGGHRENFAVRGAYLEVLGDLLGSLAAVVAAVVIWAGGPLRIDAVASLLIAGMMAPRALALLASAAHVLLEGAPRGLDLGHVREHILGVPGVLDVHDLHAWTITSGRPVLTAHVVVAEEAIGGDCGASVLDRLADCLDHHFDVAHSTFQLEPSGHRDHEPRMH
jgi:cobalt-zinc-cadmium efflux system protein